MPLPASSIKQPWQWTKRMWLVREVLHERQNIHKSKHHPEIAPLLLKSLLQRNRMKNMPLTVRMPTTIYFTLGFYNRWLPVNPRRIISDLLMLLEYIIDTSLRNEDQQDAILSLSTRWFKYDRDWFVCKQAALRSSCATLREWSHNRHPPSCSVRTCSVLSGSC